jgi:hypothetical protein
MHNKFKCNISLKLKNQNIYCQRRVIATNIISIATSIYFITSVAIIAAEKIEVHF